MIKKEIQNFEDQESLSNIKSLNLLKKLFVHINPKRRIQLVLLLLIMLISGLLELITLGLVVPFLSIITNPEILENNQLIKNYLIQNFEFGTNDLIFIFSALFALSALISGIIRIFNYWLNGRLSALITSDFSVKGFNLTINQPYINHINNKSSNLIIASTKQFEVFGEVLRSILQFITSFISIFLILGIFLINWKITIYFISIIVPFYILIAIFVKRKLVRNSNLIAQSSVELVKIVQDSFGSIRDIILDKSFDKKTSNYKSKDIIYRLNTADNYFYRAFPRYALETIGIISISLTAAIFVVFSKILISFRH